MFGSTLRPFLLLLILCSLLSCRKEDEDGASADKSLKQTPLVPTALKVVTRGTLVRTHYMDQVDQELDLVLQCTPTCSQLMDYDPQFSILDVLTMQTITSERLMGLHSHFTFTQDELPQDFNRITLKTDHPIQMSDLCQQNLLANEQSTQWAWDVASPQLSFPWLHGQKVSSEVWVPQSLYSAIGLDHTLGPTYFEILLSSDDQEEYWVIENGKLTRGILPDNFDLFNGQEVFVSFHLFQNIPTEGGVCSSSTEIKGQIVVVF